MKLTSFMISDMLPKHNIYQNKGDMGRVFIIGSSTGMTGAVSLSAMAALRSGSGLVTVGIPKSLNNIFEIKITEAMSYPLDDVNGELSVNCINSAMEFAKKCDCVAIGPGAGQGEGISNLVKELILNYNGKLIIDADGINVLSKNKNILYDKKCDILLTPHPGEMSRLTGLTIEEIQNSRENTAIEFAEKYNVNLILKGHNSIITDGNRTYINPTGNEGMATGGSGDVLTGIVASFCAQGLNCFDSAACGAYIHGLAGDYAKKSKTSYGLIASDIIENLPQAFKKLVQKEDNLNERKSKGMGRG